MEMKVGRFFNREGEFILHENISVPKGDKSKCSHECLYSWSSQVQSYQIYQICTHMEIAMIVIHVIYF